jgi:outer membrane protein
MFKTKALLAAAGALALAAAAHADPAFTPEAKGTLVVTVRVTDVSPQSNAPILTSAGADTGLRAQVGYDVMPTLGFTYFLTDHIAAEAILGSTQHHVSATAPGVNAPVRDEWVLPPIVTLQYHLAPKSRLDPYLGAGVNYMLFYAGHDYAGFHTHLKDGFGWAVQGGLNYAVAGPWSLNLDAKKVFFKTNATINGGALTSHLALDPWVLSAGFSRRF